MHAQGNNVLNPSLAAVISTHELGTGGNSVDKPAEN
jgi:hypothetical protein